MPRSRHVGRVGLITALGLVAAPLNAPPATADHTPSSVFISEIHYDNAGSDVGEAIEVAAEPGTDLSGWSIVLYNGSGGVPYDTDPVGTPSAEGIEVVNYPGNGIQNGSPDGVALVDGTTVVEFISYEGTVTAVGGPADGMTSTDIEVEETGETPAGQSLQRDPVDHDIWTGPAASTFGAVNGTGEQEPPPADIGACGDEATLVSAVQGSGPASPLAGETRTVEAVITAIKPGLSGFYVQEEVADADTDPTTSEGVFVFSGTRDNGALTVGELVRVQGTVGEFAGSGSSQTQLTAPQVLDCATATAAIAPTPVTFPFAAADDLEHHEGMLVVLTDRLVISEYFNYDRFGEVVLAKPFADQDRLYTPTAVVEPGDPARALAAEQDKRIITLDDYNSSQNPATIPHPGNGDPFSATNTFRGGDTVTGVRGVVDHTFGQYRIQPTEYGEYAAANPRPTGAPTVGGDLQVASFNVLNYFNGDGRGGGFPTSRGADTQVEFDRQSEKIEAALAEIDADVVGLIEIENDVTADGGAVDELVDRLNAELAANGSPRTYAYVNTGPVGTDEIKNAFIYDTATITLEGFAVLDDVDPFTRNTRPPIAARFVEKSTGEEFVPIVNHFKSKGSGTGANADQADGQGASNADRVLAAQALVEWTETDGFFAADDRLLVIGDLNAYDKEDPIDVLVGAGYRDLIAQFGGELAYGYVFDGLVGYLDHALSNEVLTPLVTGAQEWHINADEPDILDYNLDFGRPDSFYTDGPHRASDHDAVLVGLTLDDGSDPEPADCLGLVPTVVGGDGGGRVTGTNGDDVIMTGDGDDVVLAGNGEDVICVGEGDNVVLGGNGDDRILTGDGDNVVLAGNGDDEIATGDGDDVVLDGNGDDVIDAGAGDNQVVDG